MTPAFPTTDLSDAHPDKTRTLHLPLRDFGGKHSFCGPIRTAVTMEDTALVKRALYSQPGDGGVIVLDGGGSLRRALLGDLMAAKLIENGWAGIVINGAVRDARALAQMDLGIKALGATPVRPDQNGIGAVDVPVAFGSVLFEPGQFIYCDADGVLVSDTALVL